jgi:beta-galactosidase/beta-glucuronidase
MVLRWSNGNYLEDQDMWRMSGIFRDVSLLHKTAEQITDYPCALLICSTDFKPRRTGSAGSDVRRAAR